MPESARTRSSGPLVGLNPTGGAPDPTLVDGLLSLSVLPVVAGSRGSLRAPGFGFRAAAPYSSALLGFAGMAAARSPVSAILRAAASSASRGALDEGPLTVERAEDFTVPADLEGFIAGARPCGARGFRTVFFLPAIFNSSISGRQVPMCAIAHSDDVRRSARSRRGYPQNSRRVGRRPWAQHLSRKIEPVLRGPRTAAAIFSRGIFGVRSACSRPFTSWKVSANCV